MRRRLSILAFLSLLGALTASAAMVEPAHALVGEPITLSENTAWVKGVIAQIDSLPTTPTATNPATSSAVTSAQVEAGMTEARIAAGAMPSLARLGLTGIVAGAGLYTGWKIGSPIGGYIYKRMTGVELGSTPSGGPWLWKSYCPTAGVCAKSSLSSFNGFPVTDTAGGDPSSGMYLAQPYCYPSNASGCTGGATATLADWLHAQAGTELAAITPASGTGTNYCGTVAAGVCVLKVQSQAQFMRTHPWAASDASEYASATGRIDTGSFNTPSLTDAQTQAGIQQLGGYSSTTSGANAEGARCAINMQLDPDYECGTAVLPGDAGGGTTGTQLQPFRVLMPLPGETYSDYIERLRATGYLGTITVVDTGIDTTALEGSPYAAAAINTVAKVTVANPSVAAETVPLYDATGETEPWPANAPTVQENDTDIEIEIKPPTTLLPPPDDDGGACPCAVAPIVLPDVVGACDKFPFGVFCWVGDQVELMFLGPAIPWHAEVDFPEITTGDFTFDMPAFNWDFADTDVFDSTFTIIRDVLGFFLWLWGLWIYGKRKFGGKGLPDGGEGDLESIGE